MVPGLLFSLFPCIILPACRHILHPKGVEDMRKRFSSLQRIERSEPITAEEESAFRRHLQDAMLLALQEQGVLTAAQYRRAGEKLKQQRIRRAQVLLPDGEER